MTTNPILGRRDIPATERLQKALATLVVTAFAVAGAWLLTGASTDSDPLHLAGIAALALIGLTASTYFGLKKYETGRDKEQTRAIRERIGDDRRGGSWVGRIGFSTRRLLFGTVFFAGVAIALCGVALLCLQAYGFLKSGDWPSYSLLRAAWPHVDWLRNPQSWYGLHRIVYDFLNIVPASLALLIVGWLVAGIGSAFKGRIRR